MMDIGKLTGMIRRHHGTMILYSLFVMVVFAMLEYPNALKAFDDYFYSFHFSYPPVNFNGGDYDVPLTSWSQLIDSQVNHYFSNNGRFIVHSASQMFINFLGYDMLCLAVALLSLLAIELLTRLAVPSARITIWQRLVMVLVFLLISPWIFLNNTWSGAATFTLCYTIPTVGWLYAIYLLRRFGSGAARHRGALLYAALFLLGIAIGSLHEGYSVCFGSAVAIFCIRRLRRLDARTWWLVAGLFLGSLIVVFSPGIHHRAGEFDAMIRFWVMVRNVYESSHVLFPAGLAVLLSCVACCISRWRSALKEAWHCSRLVMTAGVIEYIFVIWVTDMGPDTRAFTPFGIALILYVGSLIIGVIDVEWKKLPRIFTATLVVVISAITVTAFHYGVINRHIYQQREAQYRNSRDGLIVIPREGNGYRSPWTSGFSLFGVVAPSPWNPKFVFGNQAIACYYDKHEPWYLPAVDLDNLEPYRIDSGNDSLRVYAPEGEWWVIVRGLPRGKYEAKATAYRYASPVKRLWKWIYPDDVPSVPLFSTSFTHDGGHYLVISRCFSSRINEIGVYRGGEESLRVAVPE